MKARRNVWYAFYAGLLVSSGIHMIDQDIRGVDAWQVYERAGWITMSPAWGIAVWLIGSVLLGVAFWNVDH